MLKERQEAARALHMTFLDVERSIDAAATKMVQCQAQMMATRSRLNLGYELGRDALAKISEASALLTKALDLVAEAHPMMKAIPDQIGLRTVGYGHVEPTPSFDGNEPNGKVTVLQVAA